MVFCADCQSISPAWLPKQVLLEMVMYRELHVDAPLQVFGNVVVIDVQEETATVKVLSSRDAVNMGDLVMLRPTR